MSMIKCGDLQEDKGASTSQEVMSAGDARLAENSWSVVRNNANNSWYVNLNNGNINNNNVYNRYVTSAVSELTDEGGCIDRLLHAEELCYKNKHDSKTAAHLHLHLSKVVKMADEVRKGEWNQGTAIVFGIEYPTLREVWAAAYTDRILHHDVAPILVDATERIHIENGNVSHGNRKGHSAYTAACQILQYINDHPDWVVAKRDISGFFMSINKERSYQNLVPYFNDHSKDNLIRSLITHNPTKDCEMRSPTKMMMRIPKNKSLFYARDGYGIPIGNFYSQLVANSYLKDVDALAMSDRWMHKVRYTRFVDDICVVADSPKTANEFFDECDKVLNDLELRFNERKRYMQPASHGVNFCGYAIKPHRIYIGNRTLLHCKATLRECSSTIEGAKKVIRSLNSYFGFFGHCASWKIQLEIAKRVHEKFGEYIRYKVGHQQVLFTVAPKYTIKYQVINNINLLKQNLNDLRKNHRRDYESRGSRTRNGSGRRRAYRGRTESGRI